MYIVKNIICYNYNSLAEMQSNLLVESSFANIDEIIQHQQHPTRAAHDNFFFFFFKGSGAHRDLPSSPTRRFSDLVRCHEISHRMPIAMELPPATTARAQPDTFGAAADLTTACSATGALRIWVSIGMPCNCSRDRKSTRLNSSHSQISYAVFCLKKK